MPAKVEQAFARAVGAIFENPSALPQAKPAKTCLEAWNRLAVRFPDHYAPVGRASRRAVETEAKLKFLFRVSFAKLAEMFERRLEADISSASYEEAVENWWREASAR